MINVRRLGDHYAACGVAVNDTAEPCEFCGGSREVCVADVTGHLWSIPCAECEGLEVPREREKE